MAIAALGAGATLVRHVRVLAGGLTQFAPGMGPHEGSLGITNRLGPVTGSGRLEVVSSAVHGGVTAGVTGGVVSAVTTRAVRWLGNSPVLAVNNTFYGGLPGPADAPGQSTSAVLELGDHSATVLANNLLVLGGEPSGPSNSGVHTGLMVHDTAGDGLALLANVVSNAWVAMSLAGTNYALDMDGVQSLRSTDITGVAAAASGNLGMVSDGVNYTASEVFKDFINDPLVDGWSLTSGTACAIAEGGVAASSTALGVVILDYPRALRTDPYSIGGWEQDTCTP